MATGYTHNVRTGEVTDFQTFALHCARAFGALILMRDDPMDAPIPDAFEASTFHRDSLRRETDRLLELRAMTPQEADEAARAAFDRALVVWEQRQSDRSVERQRYEAMLTKVWAWEPPSADHHNYKRFMIEQLESSIEFDCSDGRSEQPVCLQGDVWRSNQMRLLEQSIEYHKRADAEEGERTAGRNRWIQQLRDSLKESVVSHAKA